MSWSDRLRPTAGAMRGRFGPLLLVMVAAPLLGACQVRPLHAPDGIAQGLAPVAISAADTRVEQAVRNRLVFLLSGGRGEPASADYRLDLDVTTSRVGVLVDQSRDTATAGRLTVSARYTLTAVATGDPLVSRSRSVTAAYDLPDQEFAGLRSTRDAEDRASRELADIIGADLAAALRR